MSVTMHALEDCDTYSETNETSKVVGGLTTNQEIHVTGQSKETGWYEIEINGSKQKLITHFLLYHTNAGVLILFSNLSSLFITDSIGNIGSISYSILIIILFTVIT